MNAQAGSPRRFASGFPASPCVGVCRISPDDGFCVGCLRTIDEIAHWGLFTVDERREVLSLLQDRRQARAQRGPS